MNHVKDAENDTYYCNGCGAASNRWQPKCPECGESVGMNMVGSAFHGGRDERGRFERGGVRGIVAKRPARVRTWIEGVDRVMGADEPGFAVGTTTFLGGGQGAGKSTLALQCLAGMSVTAPPSLVVMNEEPRERLRLRADRCGLVDKLDHVQVREEKTFTGTQALIEQYDPRVLVIDSFSMMVDPDHDTNDRQENQKRYMQWLFEDGDRNKRVVILISHLNKEDDFSGPRFLQYLLDAIIRVRRLDKRHVLLDCVEKNRWGDPADTAMFKIDKSGLHEIERADDTPAVADQGQMMTLFDDTRPAFTGRKRRGAR